MENTKWLTSPCSESLARRLFRWTPIRRSIAQAQGLLAEEQAECLRSQPVRSTRPVGQRLLTGDVGHYMISSAEKSNPLLHSMTEDKARIVIASVRRSNKQSNKTDLELLDDCQTGCISTAVLALLLFFESINTVIEHPQSGSAGLLICAIAFSIMVNRVGKCIGTKRILFQKERFNLD